MVVIGGLRVCGAAKCSTAAKTKTANPKAQSTTSSLAVTVPRLNSTISMPQTTIFSPDSTTSTTQTDRNAGQTIALTGGFLDTRLRGLTPAGGMGIFRRTYRFSPLRPSRVARKIQYPANGRSHDPASGNKRERHTSVGM
ncbi:MAG: hypothetical protein OXU29_02100 [Gammaproteobacteria bacterium]|nr:hypothetical protein [Gammaproteobacteria bacterium]